VTIQFQPKILIQKISSSHLNHFSKIELDERLESSVLRAIQVLRDKNSTVGFAESCTAGLLSSSFGKVPGVSDVFMGSLVAYANYVKADVLNVKTATIEKYGAVSAECAKEMSENALMLLKVRYAVSITGIAGPQGGSEQKPVGTVFISVSGISDATEVEKVENERFRNSFGTVTTMIFQHDLSSLKEREDIQLAAAINANEDFLKFVSQQEIKN
jgi:PncC family amidohydrolase